jgi:integrase
MATPVLRAFTLVAAFSGLRLECEVGRLCADDVDGDRLHVRCGKGAKARTSVLFEPGLSALLEVAHPYGHLLRNARGYPWTRSAVNKRWRQARATVGLHGVVFHDLRKFHATWLLDRGVSRMDVAVQLGHFDRDGRPNTQLVDEVYGWPSAEIALGRVAAVAGATVAP